MVPCAHIGYNTFGGWGRPPHMIHLRCSESVNNAGLVWYSEVDELSLVGASTFFIIPGVNLALTR